MRDIDKALSDIASIRSQIAAGTMFRGFGPAVIAATGCLALLMATAQWLWPERLASDPATFLLCWVATAVVCSTLVWVEMVARARRHHAGLADHMILNAVEHFAPSAFAGAALGAVLYRYSPETLWILPGLWQVLVALGLFASIRTLPKAITIVAAWYFLAGIATVAIASSDQLLSPWEMGLPFFIGQIMMAVVLHVASEGEVDEH